MEDSAKCSGWAEEQLSGSGDLKRSGKQPAGEKHPAGNPGRIGRCFHFRLRGGYLKKGRNSVPDAGFSLRVRGCILKKSSLFQ